MATDYLNVRNDINEMRQRKLELEETLKMSDEDILRSVIRNDRSQQQGQLPSATALHIQHDPAEVEQYLQLTSEKVKNDITHINFVRIDVIYHATLIFTFWFYHVR